MCELTDAARLRQFMCLLGQRTRTRGRVYLVGGACAVWLDWRPTTIDIDLDLDPGLDALLREIPAIKEELRVNVELASPAQFIPELPGWRDRSPFVIRATRPMSKPVHVSFWPPCFSDNVMKSLTCPTPFGLSFS